MTFLRTIRDAAAANATLTNDDVDIDELNALLASLPEVVPGKDFKILCSLNMFVHSQGPP